MHLAVSSFHVDGIQYFAGIVHDLTDHERIQGDLDRQTQDVDATANMAIDAGGKLLREPFDIPGAGARMAVIKDPLGAVFEIIKMGPCQP